MVQKHQQKYTCPMQQEIVRDGPGKCPICGMNLVPVEKPESDDHRHMHQSGDNPPWVTKDMITTP